MPLQAQIFTNDAGSLGRIVSRDVTKSSAVTFALVEANSDRKVRAWQAHSDTVRGPEL